MKLKNLHSFLLILLILLINIYFMPVGYLHQAEIEIVNANARTIIPIKWAVIVTGGYSYYRDLTYNAIQRIEKVMQGQGFPFDLFQDDDIEAPTDNPSQGRYPLQFANGLPRYQAIVLLCDYEKDDLLAVNQKYIYWAVANGTNILIFNKAAMFVSDLLGITGNEIRWVWAQKTTNLIVLKSFNDGIKEYKLGSNISIPVTLQWHAVIHRNEGITVWVNKTWDDGWTIGMANTTFGKGKVWYLSWSWNDAFRLEDTFMKYTTTWSIHHFDFWGHAINFAFQNVEQVPVKIMPYKKWKGAWIIRFDTDHFMWEDYWLPDESILSQGWTWDYHFCVLGYGRPGGVHDLTLIYGAPDGYKGIPSSRVMHTNVTGVLHISGLLKDYVAIIYNSSTNSGYDRIKIDFNEDGNFGNDFEYELWQDIEYPEIVGRLYWCSIIPNAMQPEKINLGWWQTPMLFKNEDVREKYKDYGNRYGLSYSLHGWQHTEIPYDNSTCSLAMWNGTDFILNATYIKEKFEEAKYWMSYSLGSGGYGFEASEAIISYPGDNHPDPVHDIVGDLPWVLFESIGTTHAYFVGFARQNPRYKYWLSSSRIEYWYDETNLTIIQEMVQTLYPIISTYGHMLNDEIFNKCSNYNFPPYTNSIKPANPREAFHFWENSKYMLEHTAYAFYNNSKVVLEFKANNTLKDYVWRFPIEIEGKYFNNFLDNRTLGKIKHIDGKYVYVEFNEGNNEKIEVGYGTNPQIYQISNPVNNLTQTFMAKNLKIDLWNDSGVINIKVNCGRFKQPSMIKVGEALINFSYDSITNLCSFNITMNGLTTVNIIWEKSPPNPPKLISPNPLDRFDPNGAVTFIWEFSDPDFRDSQYAYQLQLSLDFQFTSIIIDTGKIASSLTQSLQNLPNNVGLYYWRVKTWDSQDAEGEWSNAQPIIVDRIKIITKKATDERTDVGTSVLVCFRVVREFDNTLFDGSKGTLYINEMPATWDEADKCWKINVTQNRIGEWKYKVSNIMDTEYHITAVNDVVGEIKIVWDRLEVTVTPDSNFVPVGTIVHFEVKAVYVYDGKPVQEFKANILRDGIYFATNNFTDISHIPCTHEYIVENVIENLYGLTAFKSDSVIITWTPKSTLEQIAQWINSNILILAAIIQLTFLIAIVIIRKERKKKSE